MLSLAEISDRLEIQQLLVDYSTAIGHRRFDDADKVFTPATPTSISRLLKPVQRSRDSRLVIVGTRNGRR